MFAVPPLSAPGMADAVSIGSVGCHVPVPSTTPTGIGTPFHTTKTATVPPRKPVPRVKNRNVGYAASTHVGGEVATAPAGNVRLCNPTDPVTPNGSLPFASPAPCCNDQPLSDPSKLPPGASL